MATEPASSDRVPTSDEFEALLASATGPQEPVTKSSMLSRLLWILAAIPTVALALLLSLATRVRLDTGAWPTLNQPDPKDLGLHYGVTVWTMLAAVVAVVLVPIVSLIGYFALGNRRVPAVPPLLAIVGFVALLVVLTADLGGLGEWIAD